MISPAHHLWFKWGRYHLSQFLLYPLVICYIVIEIIEHGPVEIVDLPIEHGWIFQFVM